MYKTNVGSISKTSSKTRMQPNAMPPTPLTMLSESYEITWITMLGIDTGEILVLGCGKFVISEKGNLLDNYIGDSHRDWGDVSQAVRDEIVHEKCV